MPSFVLGWFGLSVVPDIGILAIIYMPCGRTRLKEHDPSLEPIIVLDCGHAYTLSTLDGFMRLESVYVKVRALQR